jgi:hypothetical protein
MRAALIFDPPVRLAHDDRQSRSDTSLHLRRDQPEPAGGPHVHPFRTLFRDDVRSEIWSVHVGRQLGLDPHEVEQRVQEGVRASNQRVSAPIGSPTKDVFDPDSV